MKNTANSLDALRPQPSQAPGASLVWRLVSNPADEIARQIVASWRPTFAVTIVPADAYLETCATW